MHDLRMIEHWSPIISGVIKKQSAGGLGAPSALRLTAAGQPTEPAGSTAAASSTPSRNRLAVGETVILLHLPPLVVGVSIGMGRDDSLADGYTRPSSS